MQRASHRAVRVVLLLLCGAAHQALYGLSQGSARHEIINAHMAHAQRLIDHIEHDEALPIIVAAMDEDSKQADARFA